jgi:hypothetical protein
MRKALGMGASIIPVPVGSPDGLRKVIAHEKGNHLKVCEEWGAEDTVSCFMDYMLDHGVFMTARDLERQARQVVSQVVAFKGNLRNYV